MKVERKGEGGVALPDAGGGDEDGVLAGSGGSKAGS